MQDASPGNPSQSRLRFAAVMTFVFVLVAWAASVRTAEPHGVVAFGDSLSDMGNRWLKPGQADVKFRQTWVAQLAGAQMLNDAGFKPSGMSSFYGGGNYAVGGACTEYAAKFAGARGAHNLTTQVSKRYLNPQFNTVGVQRDAVHVIVIGANDLMFASAGFEQITSKWSTMEQVGAAVAKSTETQIQALATAGVRTVVWGNVFDIAQAPAVVRRANFAGERGASIYLSALTRGAVAHNLEMDAAIQRLAKANPSLTIIKLDLSAKFAEVSADPAKYGFVDVTSGANDARHLFSADGLHPTPQGHKMLAEYAFSVISARLAPALPAGAAATTRLPAAPVTTK